MKSFIGCQKGITVIQVMMIMAIFSIVLAVVATNIHFTREDNKVKTEINTQVAVEDSEQAISQFLSSDEQIEKLNNLIMVLADNQKYILETVLAKLKKESPKATDE